MSVVLSLVLSSVSSLYHLILDGGELWVLQTRVTEVLLELLKLSEPLMDGRPRVMIVILF